MSIRDDIFFEIFGLLVLLCVFGILAHLILQDEGACEKRGGILVRVGAADFKCVKGLILIDNYRDTTNE